MEVFRKEILEADMMVFVTPLYYYGMSAQLKTLIDRFCAFNSSIQGKRHEVSDSFCSLEQRSLDV